MLGVDDGHLHAIAARSTPPHDPRKKKHAELTLKGLHICDPLTLLSLPLLQLTKP